MEYYKAHRPKKLTRVVGNTETVTALTNMVERKTVPHTLLFHGPSGCGKTTLARILKDELQCHDLDFQELNSASFRGIDTIRDVQRKMMLSPVGGPVRVWLMDEVHKLSNDAQNAALKILEDTPSHVYFFLCTTEPEKLIKAVQTRCTEMPVRLLTHDELGTLVDRVAKKEGVTLSDKTRDDLITSAQGSARTALVLLEKVANLDDDQRSAAIEQKLEEQSEGIHLCRLLIKRAKWNEVTNVLKNLKGEPEQIRHNVLGYARAVLLKEANHQAYLVIDCFKDNFFDSKHPGLVRACFEAIHSK